ncbi:MAG: trypsin-like peptidase domain-containing protein [Thermoleophilia bacterium]|nr:trypsin-like peptidase domain-containing protein [Thermoleophilia bacterium]
MHRPALPLLAVIAVALVAALVGGITGAALHATMDSEPRVREVPVRQGSPTASETSPTVAEVYKDVANGIVEVTVAPPGDEDERPFDSPESRTQGSGFVYDDQGRVVTNQHVVEDAKTVFVTFPDGETFSARVLGTDASTDLAVVDVDAPASRIHALRLGDSEALEVGDQVIAIGSPFGLDSTVTTGIVSALNRQMQAPNNFTINDSIQTDAAINHGNSGGPLLNMRGEVVGVNAQIRSGSGANAGVGFAIPSSTVQDIVPRLIRRGEVEHAYLGVSIVAVPESAAKELGVPAGVAVSEVRPEGPAEAAKLRAGSGSRTVNGVSYPTGGDVITAVDGEPVRTTQDLQTAIDAHRPGDTVTLTVVRGGDTREVEVELGERPEQVTP